MSSPQITSMFGCLWCRFAEVLEFFLLCSSTFCHKFSPYPNGPMWKTMLTIAIMPIINRTNAVIRVNDAGK